MVQIQETGKGESPVQALQGTRGPYPVRPSVQSSPASLRGTGASEPHQGASTPPGRRTRTHPQRSHFPATMERAVCEQSPSQGSHLPHRTPLTIPTYPAPQLKGNTSTRCHVCLLSPQGPTDHCVHPQQQQAVGAERPV